MDVLVPAESAEDAKAKVEELDFGEILNDYSTLYPHVRVIKVTEEGLWAIVERTR